MAVPNFCFSFDALLLGLCLPLIAAQLFLHVSSNTEAGFFAEVIHRDSPESPLHNSSSTPFSRLHAAVHRSASRVAYLHRSHMPNSNDQSPGLSASLTNHNIEFLMIFYIGSNDQKSFAGIDTGSYFTWVLCNPCKDCYKHKSEAFRPSSSKSYKQLACGVSPCTLHPNTICTDTQKCEYHTKYLDQTSVGGILSTDKLGLNLFKSKRIYDMHDIIFGCTHKTTGTFDDGSIGLIGLNRGPLSLVSQLGPIYGRRFSYCLPSKFNHRSRINFGTAAVVSGSGTMTTPLFHGHLKEFYYLFLETITVGKEEPIVVSSLQGNQPGNILIDTGVLLTYINPMQGLSERLKMHIPLPPKQHSQYDLCFDTGGASEATRWLPEITLKFKGNAELVLSGKNAFTEIRDNTLCLLIVSSSRSGGEQILGYRAQLGHLIGYFDDAGILSFRNEGC